MAAVQRSGWQLLGCQHMKDSLEHHHQQKTLGWVVSQRTHRTTNIDRHQAKHSLQLECLVTVSHMHQKIESQPYM